MFFISIYFDARFDPDIYLKRFFADYISRFDEMNLFIRWHWWLESLIITKYIARPKRKKKKGKKKTFSQVLSASYLRHDTTNEFPILWLIYIVYKKVWSTSESANLVNNENLTFLVKIRLHILE